MHQLTRNQLTAVFGFLTKERRYFDFDMLAAECDLRRIELFDLLKPNEHQAAFVDELESHQIKAIIALGTRFGVIRPGERQLELVPLQVEARVDRLDYEHNPHTAELVKRQLVLELAKELERSGGLEFTTSIGAHQVSVKCLVEFLKQPRK